MGDAPVMAQVMKVLAMVSFTLSRKFWSHHAVIHVFAAQIAAQYPYPVRVV
jgi:hypothetical protein